MPASDTVTIYKGQDAVLSFHHTTGENITNWDLEFSVQYLDDELINKSADIIDSVAGDYEFIITNIDTELLRTGRYNYSVWRVDVEEEKPLASGTFILLDGYKPI